MRIGSIRPGQLFLFVREDGKSVTHMMTDYSEILWGRRISVNPVTGETAEHDSDDAQVVAVDA